MELTVKHFSQLTTRELYEIFKLRVSVFVVEQQCYYQEVDEFDDRAYHVWLHENGEIKAYLRVLPAGATFDEVSIGRVIAVERRCGLGTKIVAAGIDTARSKLNAKTIKIEAQTYARKLYENLGFVQTGDEFLEDGIPHIPMLWRDIDA